MDPQEDRVMDPIIYTQDKVLCELQEPWEEISPLNHQDEVDINMRISLAEWMAEVCGELDTEPAVFCLAVSCLDRFLSKVRLRRQQLQLLGVSCLLVAWKVRGEKHVDVDALVRYTAHSILKEELLECEMLVLTKLNWNLPSAVAVDFIQHILQKLSLKLPAEIVKDRVLSLIQTCYIHPSLAVKSPQLLAAAAVISTIRPMMQMPPPSMDTPPTSYSSCASSPPTSVSSPPTSASSPPTSASSPPTSALPPPGDSPPYPETSFDHSSAPTPSTSRQGTSWSSQSRDIPYRREKTRRISSTKMDRIIRSIQKVTLADKNKLQEVLEDIENLVKESEDADSRNLTPSPESGKFRTPEKSSAEFKDAEFAGAARHLFPDFETPTKILDASSHFSNPS